MRLLLDTHILIWAAGNDPQLGSTARDLIADPSNEKLVSAVSILEVAIKRALKPRPATAVPMSAAELISWCEQADVTLLPVEPSHAAAVEDLPPLLGDPFDRLLVAQALQEPLRLLTRDRALAAYSDMVIVV